MLFYFIVFVCQNRKTLLINELKEYNDQAEANENQ
jgi:REP element-mobilizing transposase RayT